MTWQHTRSVLVLAFSAVLLAGACSSGDDGDPAASDGAGVNAARAGSGDTATSVSDDDDEQVEASPLEEFMGWDVDVRGQDIPDEELQKFAEVERLVAECMAAEGFDYTPLEPELAANPFTFPGADLSPADYAAQYGYGITTIDEQALGQEAAAANPNEQMLDSLSEAARYAWHVAENGALAAAEKFGREVPTDADAHPGCRPEAEEAVWGNRDKGQVPAEYDRIREQMDALWDRIFGDTRVADAASRWLDCMADAGFPELTHPDDARTEIARRHWELYGLDYPSFQDEGPRRPGRDIPPPSPDPRGGELTDAAALEELQEYEIGVAVADLDCRADYDATVVEVRADVEQQFIEANRAELERYRDALAALDG